MIMEKHDVTWIFTYLKYFYIVETSIIFLQYNSNRFIYYLEMKIYNLSILCSLDFIMVFCLLSHTYVYLRVSIYVCLSIYHLRLLRMRVHLFVYVFINTCARIREICFVYVYFLLAIREFNPFEINFSFKIINIIKWKQ